MPFTVSFSSKHAIKVLVILGPFTVMFKESFYDVFLLLIYISIQCTLKISSSSESQWTSPECASSLDKNSECSGSIWQFCRTAQSITGEQIHGSASWPDQCTGMRESVLSFPLTVAEKYNRAIPVGWHCFLRPWGWGRHSRAVLWQGRLDLSSFPGAVPTSCWDPSHYTCLEVFSNLVWPPTDVGQSGWLHQLP